MIDFSFRNLNFPLNELHKMTIGIVFIQRENSSSKKIFTFRNTNWYMGKVLFPLQYNVSTLPKSSSGLIKCCTGNIIRSKYYI